MAADEGERKLAAILAADVVGYSRLMGDDERATVASLKSARGVFKDRIEAHSGRLIDTAGDSILAEFKSVVEAVQCAVEVQEQLGAGNEPVAEHRKMHFRIGINLGDIIEEDDGTIYGDGVNVAARLEGLAAPGGVMVSESAHMQVRRDAALNFEDAGAHEVKNIDGPVRAYRLGGGAIAAKAKGRRPGFAALASAAALLLIVAGGATWLLTQPEDAAPVSDPVLALPTGPKIAVLPFANRSGDPEEVYFSEGLTDDIINRLTDFPTLLVFARGSTASYRERNVDALTVGEELGADYVIEGSVRRSEGTLRVTVQLLGARDGTIYWAKTFDRDLSAASVFEIQDAITENIVNTIGDYSGEIIRAEANRIRHKPPSSLTALECVYFHSGDYALDMTEEKHLQVRDCLERAVAAEPENAELRARLSFVYREEYLFGFNALPDPHDRALVSAMRAVEIDPTFAEAHFIEALVHFNRGEVDAFLVSAERALELSPNNASILADIGQQLGWLGELERGAAMVQKAIAMNPNHPVWYHYFLSHYYRDKGDYETALGHALRLTWDWHWDFVHRVAIYVDSGRMDKARAEANKLVEVYPDFGEKARAEFESWNIPEETIQEYFTKLRAAGVDIPEGDALTN